MSLQISFTTHSKEIRSTYEAVLAGDKGIDWAIYGYEKGTNDLKVIEKGVGLEDLNDEFSDGKILYAFARVIDPNTELPKFVLIGWCGSGVPESKKGLFNSHFNDVAKFFNGYHIQINARYEADVEPAFIMKRVTESSGSKYSVHKETRRPDVPITPVGSVYKRTEVPDIAAMQREAAKKEPLPTPVRSVYAPVQTKPKPLAARWGTQNQDDQARIQQQRSDREAAERAVREREEQQQQQRQQKEQDQAEKREAEEKNRREKAEDEIMKREQAEREKRAKEIEAAEERRRIEQAEKAATEERWRNEQAEKTAAEELRRIEESRREEGEKQRLQEQMARMRFEEEERAREAEEERLRQEGLEEEKRQKEMEEAAILQEELERSSARAAEAATIAAAEEIEPMHLPGAVSALVLFSYDAAESNEISLAEGEIITDIEQVDDGWWMGRSEDGSRVGLFPANYVQILEHSEPQPEVAPEPTPESTPFAVSNDNLGQTAIALYDYIAGEENEISFAENDLIVQIEFASDDWWQGQAPNGAIGLFPSNYVELRQLN